MRLYAFPGYENHSKAHLQFRAEANGIVSESLKGRTREDVAKFFRDWLVSHIQGADQSYGRYILAGAKVVGTTVPQSPHGYKSVFNRRAYFAPSTTGKPDGGNLGKTHG